MDQQEQQLRLDLEELQRLLDIAQRKRPQQLLRNEIASLNSRLNEFQSSFSVSPTAAAPSVVPAESATSTPAAAAVVVPQQQQQQQPASPSNEDRFASAKYTSITSFGWDQTDKDVKVYVSMPAGSTVLDRNNVNVQFTAKSFDLRVLALSNNKNYRMLIPKLNKDIVPDQSSFSLNKKGDNITITLRKSKNKDEWTNRWDDLNYKEKAFDTSKKSAAAAAETEDPSAGLMKLMKQLYDEGDDEMKKTIAKSWMESSQKRAAGGAPF